MKQCCPHLLKQSVIKIFKTIVNQDPAGCNMGSLMLMKNLQIQVFRKSIGPALSSHDFHTTAPTLEIRKLARLRVVDNSEIGKQAMTEGRPPRVIHVYNKKHVGMIGDKVMVAIKGQKKKGILVGLKQYQVPKVPKFDTNNIVLIDDNGTPLGNRIHVPIPMILRTILKEKTQAKGADYTKLLAIASKFV